MEPVNCRLSPSGLSLIFFTRFLDIYTSKIPFMNNAYRWPKHSRHSLITVVRLCACARYKIRKDGWYIFYICADRSFKGRGDSVTCLKYSLKLQSLNYLNFFKILSPQIYPCILSPVRTCTCPTMVKSLH